MKAAFQRVIHDRHNIAPKIPPLNRFIPVLATITLSRMMTEDCNGKKRESQCSVEIFNGIQTDTLNFRRRKL